MEEKKLHYKMYKDGKKFVFAAIATMSFFVFGGVSTVAVHADTTSGNLTAATVNSTSDTKSAVSSAAIVASSSSATKADSTSASSSSAVKTETTSASSSSAAKAETTSASSSSAAKAETTSASSSSAAKADSTSASSTSKSSAADTTSSTNELALDEEAQTHVDKDNFSQYFTLNGSATYDAGTVTLTPDENNKEGNQIAQGEVTYPNGAEANGTYTTRQLKIPNYKFVRMDDGTATGAKSLPATGTLTKAGDNGTVIHVYVPYSVSDLKQISETIHYVNEEDVSVAPDNTKASVSFVTITNPVDGSTKNFYSRTETSTPKLDNDGKPIGDWQEGNSANFDPIANPTVNGYHVLFTSDPDNNSSQITAKIVTKSSYNLVYTVVYVPNAEKANVTYIDDKTGKTLSTKDLTGNYGSTDPYRTSETITGYESQGYQLVSDNYPTNGVVYNQDGTVQSFEVHLTHGTTQTSENQTVNETIHYVYKNGGKAADDYQATPLNFTRTVTTDKVTAGKSYGDWVAANGTSFAAVTSPAIKGYTPDQAEIGSQTVNGDSTDLEFTVTYTKNAPTITTEKKTVNETVRYVDQNGQVLAQPHTASVDFTRQVSTDAVTGEKTYGSWSADQSFDAVTSPEVKGYTADKAQIDKQTVNGDSKDLEFTVTYTKTPVAGGNVTAKYVDENGNPIADDVIASGNVGDPYSMTQKDVPGYTFKEV
ncbi:hypothetical protein EFJ78_08575, partial [Pediococcus pentosaceus]|uniref:mucin-binding protein n=1 Tax=Pediococcus pentosaceus TaxID=1255 RepID=UPI00223C4566